MDCKKLIIKVGVFIILSLGWTMCLSNTSSLAVEENDMDTEKNLFLIDDFTSREGISKLGTRWQGITDRVMGGRSDMIVRIVGEEKDSSLYMGGQVSLENNGGFIQVRLYLDSHGGPVDLREYDGIKLRVKGNGEFYNVHLKTADALFPWSYYYFSFKVTGQWQDFKIPFLKFKADNMLSERIDQANVISIALVAAKKAFEAELYVKEIYFYRK